MSALPNPAGLKYFDNSNNTPAPYGVQVPFNNESQDVWIGYDVATSQVCITNFNRTTTLVCFAAPVPPPAGIYEAFLVPLDYTMFTGPAPDPDQITVNIGRLPSGYIFHESILYNTEFWTGGAITNCQMTTLIGTGSGNTLSPSYGVELVDAVPNGALLSASQREVRWQKPEVDGSISLAINLETFGQARSQLQTGKANLYIIAFKPPINPMSLLPPLP